ncbi:NAD(P)-binding protein [Thiothrix nivea]|uniref:FAD-dependent pyridine nucleotide-disulfide oxidoreductase n=1 Tax=Thiothrix nivea (strain ATCC 35100 / DSM 5205 / JP2) TaxID=870187 RepID=A0A656HL84_THINJ|nr:NAD(P)-binding protein [Thiothrix nivea]EIJ36276.1 FAD-dependent pyridine nucleotide-disulfide oxidoreductase [Thiothrix nivea DSM 5205]
MATAPNDSKLQAHTYRRFKDGDHEWGSMHDKIFVQDTSHKCPTYIHKTPPCQGSCPSGEDIRGWLQIVRGIEKPPVGMSMQEYAFRRSTNANPFPSMMGRVCPAPCQDGCNRNDVDDFVGINSIEQYIGDSAIAGGFKFEAPEEMSGKKVAIIGGGPAGMAAAYQLRRMGHASTVFEQHPELGGMMRYGIPGYRVPRDKLAAEMQRIVDMGSIEIRCNTKIGTDVTVEQLEADYDAILWTVGCWNGRGLFVDKWAETPNCVSAVDFLEAFNKGTMKYTAPRVVCVGGGDTSIDVVSVSRRIGTLANYSENPEDSATSKLVHGDVADKVPATVTLTTLFPLEQMTAAEHEVQDALKEGVTILTEVMPKEIVFGADGRAIGLKVVECVMKGNMPEAKEGGKETIIEADLIVSAIGQFGKLDGLDDFNNGRNQINADSLYRVPGKAKHFAAGDIIRPHLLTTAIGQASIASETINQFLRSEELKKRPKVDKHHFDLMEKLHEAGLDPKSFEETKAEDLRGTSSADFAVHNYDDRSKNVIVPSSDLFLGHFAAVVRNKRTEDVPTAEEVLGHFAERMNPLAEADAVKEAGRCMSCGMCFECDNCVIYCPQDAVYRVPKKQATLGRYVATDYSRCIGCHICADVCPTGYIEMGLGE